MVDDLEDDTDLGEMDEVNPDSESESNDDEFIDEDEDEEDNGEEEAPVSAMH